MERVVPIDIAKSLFGDDFIGEDDIRRHLPYLDASVIKNTPPIQYDYETLARCKGEYLLILGVNKMHNSKDVSIFNLRNHFGIQPDIYEPCFYNQDWYLNESFVYTSLESKWFLIKKHVFEETRTVSPDVLSKHYQFPSAIQCTYAFFAVWFCQNTILWERDFIWCQDKDHNGDRVYVGKYHDVDGINKNGFSIHRHLRLRPCYGTIESF